MIGAGTIISPIVKIATTVAILAAIYLLIVRPVLDSAERTSGDLSSSPGVIAVKEATRELKQARANALNYASTLLAGSQPWRKASNAVRECVNRAGTAIVRLQRCQAFGRRISTELLSNRNFAVGYAESLAGQGRAGDAARVRRCVEEAEFEAKAMAACRKLADELLFG